MSLSIDDHVEIDRLLSLYGHILDRGQWARLGDVFTDDAILELRFPGREQSIEGLDAIRAAFSSVPQHRPHHHSDVVISEREDRAEVLSKYFSPTPDGAMVSGELEDDVIRTVAGWRIARRAITPLQDAAPPRASE